ICVADSSGCGECGDGSLDAGELCDDGNTASGDCCSSTCVTALDSTPCSDGVFCNGADTCKSGLCSQHSGNPCAGPDGDGNCAESCNENAALCNAPDPDGSACTDSAFCNG